MIRIWDNVHDDGWWFSKFFSVFFGIDHLRKSCRFFLGFQKSHSASTHLLIRPCVPWHCYSPHQGSPPKHCILYYAMQCIGPKNVYPSMCLSVMVTAPLVATYVARGGILMKNWNSSEKQHKKGYVRHDYPQNGLTTIILQPNFDEDFLEELPHQWS